MNNRIEDKIEKLRLQYRQTAIKADNEFLFPYDNFENLIKEGLHTINLPDKYGGESLGFVDTSKMIVELSKGCPSTALCLAMHFYTIGGLQRMLSPEIKEEIFLKVWEEGALFGSIGDPNVFLSNPKKSNKESYINITKVKDGYVINGVKRFVSGSFIIRYLPIYGIVGGESIKEYGLTALLIDMETKGISIKKNWNYSGMRASMTHDVSFENVYVPQKYLIGEEGEGVRYTENLIYWFRLLLVSVYQGISLKAYDYIIELVKNKVDKTTGKKLALLPSAQSKLAKMRILIKNSSTQLIFTCQKADKENKERSFTNSLYEDSLITKYIITNSAVKVINLAMDIEGTSSLNKSSLLEMLYRDVRAGSFHPPTDDKIEEYISKRELGIISIS
ncbi:acyl-CoA dehydrogenase family protein [Oceanobacillus sp. 1P07AA]|uniref:acyl-CoA dehydrogenase family protein n=1 Tax=Oceanobacillus sp. 1P07AA TaxID=3132293 RepID=UPI0039A56FB8